MDISHFNLGCSKGGDRNTLKASGNEIADCLISNFGRATYTGSDGISLYGVGTKVHHNKIWDGSYTGIRWEVRTYPIYKTKVSV